jgi:hypothetical protein
MAKPDFGCLCETDESKAFGSEGVCAKNFHEGKAGNSQSLILRPRYVNENVVN